MTPGAEVVHFRPGTSDEDALAEVLREQCYTNPVIGFDVGPGERWLDLGANIGAFAIYCARRGAMAECWEPDPDCFTLLQQNAPGFELHQSAVTNIHASTLAFSKSANPLNHWRATSVATNGLVAHPGGALPNTHGSVFRGRWYDGIKMDIEGAEAGLLDDELLPAAGKLVFEHHFSRLGTSLAPFFARVKQLERRFANVWYPPSIDQDRATGRYSGRHDPLVFAWGGWPDLA